jgi:hypothetical protein
VKRNFFGALAATALVAVPSTGAGQLRGGGQAPGSASAPAVPVSHRDRGARTGYRAAIS